MKTNKTFEYRIEIYPSDYEIGDAQDEAEVNAILERDGAWGYCVERRIPGDCAACYQSHAWEYVDSCFGFLGNDLDYMMSQALESVPAGVEVPLIEARAVINTLTGKGK